MFQQNFITNLLGIANVFVDKIENNSSNIKIYLSTQTKAQVCPCCGQATKYIHDYRTQKIRDIPFQGKETFDTEPFFFAEVLRSGNGKPPVRSHFFRCSHTVI